MGTPAPPDDGLLSLGDMWTWVTPLISLAAGWVGGAFMLGRRVGAFQGDIHALKKDLDEHRANSERKISTSEMRVAALQSEILELKAVIAGIPGIVLDRVNLGPLVDIKDAIREMRDSVERSIRDVRARVEQISDRDRGSHPARGRREPD